MTLSISGTCLYVLGIYFGDLGISHLLLSHNHLPVGAGAVTAAFRSGLKRKGRRAYGARVEVLWYVPNVSANRRNNSFFWKRTLNLNVLSKDCGIAISIESDDPSGTSYPTPSHFHSFPHVYRVYALIRPLPPQHLLDDASQHRGLKVRARKLQRSGVLVMDAGIAR